MIMQKVFSFYGVHSTILRSLQNGNNSSSDEPDRISVGSHAVTITILFLMPSIRSLSTSLLMNGTKRNTVSPWSQFPKYSLMRSNNGLW